MSGAKLLRVEHALGNASWLAVGLSAVMIAGVIADLFAVDLRDRCYRMTHSDPHPVRE